MPCGKPGCRCQAVPPELHGPYYQWTRKVAGKTATVRLTRSQATLLDTWIANGRRLDRIQMQRVSHRATDYTERNPGLCNHPTASRRLATACGRAPDVRTA